MDRNALLFDKRSDWGEADDRLLENQWIALWRSFEDDLLVGEAVGAFCRQQSQSSCNCSFLTCQSRVRPGLRSRWNHGTSAAAVDRKAEPNWPRCKFELGICWMSRAVCKDARGEGEYCTYGDVELLFVHPTQVK